MNKYLFSLFALAAFAARAATFDFAVEGKTAITYAERLEVVPVADGATNFAVEVEAKPSRGEDGKITMAAEKPFCIFWPNKAVNIAPEAKVTVSSKTEPSKGFQPKAGTHQPVSLNDCIIRNDVNFGFQKREVAPTAEDAEWLVLEWDNGHEAYGLMTFSGAHELLPKNENIVVETYVGNSVASVDDAAGNWQTISGKWNPMPKNERDRFRSFRTFEFSEKQTLKALRMRFTAGGWVLRGKQHESPNVGMGEIVVLAKPEIKAKPQTDISSARIQFTMPFDGKASIQIRDADGKVVANPVTGFAFTKGKTVAEWNLTDIDGNLILKPGTYSWRGIAVPPLKLDYLHTYYPLGIAKENMPWKSSDNHGGWLADHDPPRGVVRDGTNMWLNAWAEHGDSVIKTDSDMRKLWGITRIWVAVPQEICVDGDWCYGYSQGGWNGKDEEIIKINSKNFYSTKVMIVKESDYTKEDNHVAAGWGDASLSGFQVVSNTAFVSFGADNAIYVYDITKGNTAKHRNFGWDVVHTQFDDWKPVRLARIALPSPGRIRKYKNGQLLCTSSNEVVTIDTSSYEVKKLFSLPFENVLGLGVGDDGTIWVGAGEPLHQVFGFNEKGERIAVLGKQGRRKVGPFDFNDLEEPAGVEVDHLGRVWVTEHTAYPKRVSVWEPKTGKCVQHVIGPTRYGGCGSIDPGDPNRMFYEFGEFVRDRKTGEIELKNIIYRPDNDGAQKFLAGDYPDYAFRAKGQLWFTSFGPPHGHPQLVLWHYAGNSLKPVAAFGTRSAKEKKAVLNGISKMDFPGESAGNFYTWTDLNDDGFMQAEEMKYGDILYNDKPLGGVSAMWNWRMNSDFVAAGRTDNGWKPEDPCRTIVFRPSGFTDKGYPIYDIPTETFPSAREVQALMPDKHGNVIALGSPVRSIAPNGDIRWEYRNQWPSLHAGHKTTARGDEPGVLIATTRMWGIVDTRGDAGEVACFNSNLGCAYLMTADDGLYIDRVFRDQRVAASVWNFNVEPDPLTVAECSLYDEHFGGSLQRVKYADGTEHDLFVVGKGSCGVVELKGLDAAKRLSGGKIKVTEEMIAAARERIAMEKLKSNETRHYVVTNGMPGANTPSIDGFRLGYDEKYLYLYADYNDNAAVFENKGDNPFELFKTGDTAELMLRTGTDTKGRGIKAGDIRLIFAMYAGKPVCVMYDYKVSGTKPEERVGFSSPWRTVYVDRVKILEDVEPVITRKGNKVSCRAKIPLDAIHFKPAGTIRGDVGRVCSDATGTQAASRIYWSNKNTAIMSDLPTEVSIEPDLWGYFTFE